MHIATENCLLQTSPSTSQSLVRGAEQVIKMLSETLNSDTTEAIQIRENIGIANLNHTVY